MIITLFPLPSQLFPSDIRPLPDLWVEVPGANFEKHLEDGNPHCPARLFEATQTRCPHEKVEDENASHIFCNVGSG